MILHRGLGSVVGALVWVSGGVAGVLVGVEVGVLFVGVVARYGFDAPLVWSDDIAGALFLWLSLLGAVAALARGEHMRLGTVVEWMGPRLRQWVVALGYGGVVVFLGALLRPAWAYTVGQWWVTSPALEFPDALRVAALPVGAGLMLGVALWEMVREAGWRAVPALLGWGVVLVGLRGLEGELAGLGPVNLVLFFLVGLGVLVAMGVPIAFAFGLATVGYLGLSTHVPLAVVVGRMDGGMSGMILLAVPLFVFLGLLIEMTGLAAALVDFLAALLGHVRGGLAYVLIAAIYLVSGISGSKAADMAAVAPALFPEMRARGAAPGRLVALLAASAAMAETIPPSLVLITIGSVTGVSIAALFSAGLLPATLGALALAALVFWQARRLPLGETARLPAREVRRRFLRALPALVLPVLIRFAVVDGIATATEVSTVGIVYTLLAGLFLYRRFAWRRAAAILVETASLSGAILLIIGTATAMGWALTQSGFAHLLLTAVHAMPGGRAGFWAASIAAFTLLGSLLEGIPAIVLFGPLFFPIARSLGIDEVHYAIVVVLAMGLGLFAPPFGVGFYTACAIGKVPPDHAFTPVWPYLALLLLTTLTIAAFPQLAPH